MMDTTETCGIVEVRSMVCLDGLGEILDEGNI